MSRNTAKVLTIDSFSFGEIDEFELGAPDALKLPEQSPAKLVFRGPPGDHRWTVNNKAK
jgi:hypothetical protein